MDGMMGVGGVGGACGAGGSFAATVASALQMFAAAQCALGEPWPPLAAPLNGSRFDFIVVGGGTAGATLAARLSARPDRRVLLIEAGPDPPVESIVPDFRNDLKGSSYDWNFTSIDDGVTSQALQGGSQNQPRGRMLGGSGSINDMVYARGFPADYDQWADALGDHWRWENVLPYFIKTEHMTDERIVDDPELMRYHGRGGEIEVTGFTGTKLDTVKFIEAFEELGFPAVKDMTNPTRMGVGGFSHTIKAGRRDGSLTGLLNGAGVRDNLFVLKDSLVSRILIENNRAVGVQVLQDESTFQFYANKEVIVSAGTFNTPKLLLLSGIGPRTHLETFGIDVVQDLPVGDNLHDHVMVLTYLAAENGTCFTSTPAYFMDTIKYLYDRTGPLARSDSMGAYVSLSGSTNVPDFAIYPTCVSIGEGYYDGCMNVLGYRHEICDILNKVNANYELLSLAVVLLKPKSRGTVRLRSTDPLDDPLIYTGTFSDPEDLNGFPKVLERARAIANTTYFRGKGARPVELDIAVCVGQEGEEGERCRARALAMSAWHSVGTAAMGGVLDGRLRVLGVDGLRVVDASAVPTIMRGNTNAPVVAIAEMAADFIQEAYD